MDSLLKRPEKLESLQGESGQLYHVTTPTFGLQPIAAKARAGSQPIRSVEF